MIFFDRQEDPALVRRGGGGGGGGGGAEMRMGDRIRNQQSSLAPSMFGPGVILPPSKLHQWFNFLFRT